MLRHQRQFQAMLRRIDDGEFLVKELNVALESYDEATTWLTGVGNGDQVAIDAVIKKHGHEISHEGVSLEGVQVHINSEQVQAVVDFLRRWIPKLLEMLRDVTARFFKWLRTKFNDLDAKIARVKTRLQQAVSSEIKLGPEHSNVTLAILDGHGHYLGNIEELQWALRWVGRIADDVTRNFNLNAHTTLDSFDLFLKPISGWLTLDNESALFSSTAIGWQKGDPINQIPHAIRDLPSISDALSEAENSLGQRFTTQLGAQLVMNRQAALDRLDKINRTQMRVVAGCTEVEKDLQSISQTLDRFSSQKAQELPPEHALGLSVAIRSCRYALNSTTRGLQWRLSQMGKAVDALSGFKRTTA